MKRNYIIALILVFPIVLLFCWVVMTQEKISKSASVLVSVTGYDPRDLLSGHYIILLPQWGKTDCSQFDNNECPEEDFDSSYRFYLPEEDAKYLDRVVIRSENLEMQLEFAMPKKAFPIIKELYINGLVWKKWLIENPNFEY